MIVCGQIEFSKHVNLCSPNGERTPSPGTTPFDGGQDACAPEILVPDLVLSNDAKETVFFVRDSSREKHSVGERQKIPQAIKLQRRSIRPHERCYKIAADWIVIVDESITEVANPKVGAFHERKSPWGIEVSI